MDARGESAEFRERFLRFASALNQKKVDISMYEKTAVNGKMIAVKGDGSHFLVASLATPIGVQDTAALRTSDTVCVSVNFGDLDK